jgi:thymidylate kinase
MFMIPIVVVMVYVSYLLIIYESITEVDAKYIVKESASRYKNYLRKHVGWEVVFSGLDGCGKTTHIILIYTFLSREGIKVRYVWLRWFSFFSTPFYLYTKLIKGRSIKINYAGKTRVLHIFSKDPVLNSLYPRVHVLDVILKYIFVKLTSIIGKTDVILVDRAFLDVIVDLIYETKNTKLLKSVVFKFVLRHCQKSKMVLLLCDPSIALKRKSRKELILGRELKIKHKLYQILATSIPNKNIVLVDTSYDSIITTNQLIGRWLRL